MNAIGGLIILLLLLSGEAHAEYRAFMLHLVNSKTKVVRQMLSTLDPDQYRTLFPIGPNEKITYVQTWRCDGRTSGLQPICEKPDKKPARLPSASGLGESLESPPAKTINK